MTLDELFDKMPDIFNTKRFKEEAKLYGLPCTSNPVRKFLESKNCIYLQTNGRWSKPGYKPNLTTDALRSTR